MLSLHIPNNGDQPLVVIDFGTATTFCAISENEEYLGGTIAPGLKISSEALFEKTAKLPKVRTRRTGTYYMQKHNTEYAVRTCIRPCGNG